MVQDTAIGLLTMADQEKVVYGLYETAPFLVTWTIPNPDFKVRPLVDAN